MIIKVPATSANLGPGFDTLGLAIKIHNCVTIKPSKFFSVSIKGEGAQNPKLKTNNLYFNIFNDVYSSLTDSKEHFRFEFHNKIPISRGLGSSSAVIVSAIASAYRMAEVKSSKREILNRALKYENHPDNITSTVMGGFNVSCVDRGKVYSQSKKIPKSVKAVLVIPDKPISTSKSRNILPSHYRKEDAVYSLSRSSLMVSAFFNERWEILRIASKDRLHQFKRMKTFPELFTVQKIALENGAIMSTLSGSGSTFFSMTYEDDAKKVSEKLSQKFPNFKVLIQDFDNDGVFSS
ncbi:MAG: homoserine kinase [Campylobacterota bacterium]